MKLEDYFQLTLEQRKVREEALTACKNSQKNIDTNYGLEDYYKIEDAISFLEKLRTQQLTDIMTRMQISKYKLF